MNLNLWRKHLGQVPDEVWELADQLETLVLADNGLTVIPARIGTLTHLRMLDLGHNGISALPIRAWGAGRTLRFSIPSRKQAVELACLSSSIDKPSISKPQRKPLRDLA